MVLVRDRRMPNESAWAYVAGACIFLTVCNWIHKSLSLFLSFSFIVRIFLKRFRKLIMESDDYQRLSVGCKIFCESFSSILILLFVTFERVVIMNQINCMKRFD